MESILPELINSLSLNKQFIYACNEFFKKIATEFHIGYAYIKNDNYDPIIYQAKYDENTKFEYKNEIVSIVFYKDSSLYKWTDKDYYSLDILAKALMPYILNEINKIKLAHISETQFNSNLPNKLSYLNNLKKIDSREIILYNSYYINIKSFSLFNQEHGHEFGDKVIRSFGEGLDAFRNQDEYIAHLGADTYIALLKRVRTNEFLNFISEFNTTIEHKGEKIFIKLSAVAGIYEIKDSSIPVEKFISYAKMAYKNAKDTKKDYVYLTKELQDSISTAKEVAMTFKDDLNDGSFVTYYQPKVDIKSGRIIGCEALARLIKNGVVYPPSFFVPVLEEHGLIVDLDLYILERSCRDISKYKSFGNRTVPISCNISRVDLEYPNIEERILGIIKKYDVAYEYIILEITETKSLEQMSRLQDFIKIMRQNNIKVSIDDFGSGYSTLSTLRDFKVNEIKIDRSFINKKIYESDRIILSSIIEMARKLNIHVICEGVETKKQAMFLMELGCDNAQGYLYDMPLSRLEFEERLKNEYYKI